MGMYVWSCWRQQSSELCTGMPVHTWVRAQPKKIREPQLGLGCVWYMPTCKDYQPSVYASDTAQCALGSADKGQK